MTRRSLAAVGVALFTLGAWDRPCRADDKWEFGLRDDDDSNTANIIEHGVSQTHDLQGTAAAPDQDWLDVYETIGHSYQVLVYGGTLGWNASGGCAACANLHRVTFSGSILTSATGFGAAGEAILSWIYTGGGTNNYVRVMGSDSVDYTTSEEYDIRFHDTTYFIPRWNNSASQATIVIIQNHAAAIVTGEINFYNAAGTLLHTEFLNLAPRGTQVFNSATVPALQGASGSVAIAHLGGWGALSGKAVALEVNTGFTFDTMMTPFAP